ncbi:MAG: hypothetical protein H7832_04660 [Magnetococcus sp. DMHC-6]
MKQQIHQLQLIYNPEEDRILFRVNTNNHTEFCFWLTRRFVRRLFPGLQGVLENSGEASIWQDPSIKKAVLNFEHEAALMQSDFNTPFQEENLERPMGKSPILITKAQLTPQGEHRHLLSLHPTSGVGIEMGMTSRMLHSFFDLLIKCIKQTDWDLKSELSPSPQIIYPELSKRKLH